MNELKRDLIIQILWLVFCLSVASVSILIFLFPQDKYQMVVGLFISIAYLILAYYKAKKTFKLIIMYKLNQMITEGLDGILRSK